MSPCRRTEVPKIYIDDQFVFTLVEEKDFFRMKVDTPVIEQEHVEEFLDTTVEWLSTNPKKGILIDFKGVQAVCGDFAVELARHYESIKAKGLNVRFVNVDPVIQPFIDVSNITVVLTDVFVDKPKVSAKLVLEDIANDLSDRELMQKHGLTKRGLASMYKKLLRTGLIGRKQLAQRMGVKTRDLTLILDGKLSGKAVVNAVDVLQDIADNLTDVEIMHKYRLSRKGLQSLMRKLYRRGLINRVTLQRRKGLGK